MVYGKMANATDKANIKVQMGELSLENGLMMNYNHLVDCF